MDGYWSIMGEKLVVGPFKKGLQNNVLPFLVDNDAFPTLINAYQWRGRIKRKRGTQLLNRLKRYFDSTSESYYTGAVVTLDGDGEANLLVSYGLQEGTIVPGSVVITGGAVYTDPGEDGILETGGNPAGTINYATSEIASLLKHPRTSNRNSTTILLCRSWAWKT